jgi:hypothetical protein
VAASGYSNADVAQPADDDLAEAAMDSFANLAKSTSAYRGIVSTSTDESYRLTKQLEENSQTLKDIRALLKKERNDRGYRRPFAPSIDNYCWTHDYKIARNKTIESCMYPKIGHKHEATKNNNMGGSQANKELVVGEKLKHNSIKFEDCRTPPLLHHHEPAMVDSDCTQYFLLMNAPCHKKTKYINPSRVRLPNCDTMD